MAENTEYKNPSQSTITEWKKKHKDVYAIEVKADNGEILKAYMRSPGLRDMQIAAASEKKKAGTYTQSIFENCKLEAHPEIISNDKYLISALGEIEQIVELAPVEVKKL